mgnify:CR=1 FL=1
MSFYTNFKNNATDTHLQTLVMSAFLKFEF